MFTTAYTEHAVSAFELGAVERVRSALGEELLDSARIARQIRSSASGSFGRLAREV